MPARGGGVLSLRTAQEPEQPQHERRMLTAFLTTIECELADHAVPLAPLGSCARRCHGPSGVDLLVHGALLSPHAHRMGKLGVCALRYEMGCLSTCVLHVKGGGSWLYLYSRQRTSMKQVFK